MNNDIITKIFELRDHFWDVDDAESIVFLKHILVYLYEYRNLLPNPEISIYIPGTYDLVKADKILYTLGYRRYSIEYYPRVFYLCESTKITFRNNL